MAASDPPNHLIAALLSADPAVRLAGIRRVVDILPITLDTFARLEQMALADPDPLVREAALDVVESAEIRRWHASQPNSLPVDVRSGIVLQITRWLFAGKIRPEQARVMRARYSYDFQITPLSSQTNRALPVEIQAWQRDALLEETQAAVLLAEMKSRPAAVPVKQPAPVQASTAQPPQAAGPAVVLPTAKPSTAQTAAAPAARASLVDVLFSEVSIRIALFLGGFLIAAAALIFATLVETARLPVLLTMSAASGLGAVLLRRRLPLPGVVLFLLFAALLPIDARVLADLLRLPDDTLALFWTVTWALEAPVVILGSLGYRSRLLAVIAPFTLDLAAIQLARLVDIRYPYSIYNRDIFLPALITALLSLISLAAVGWMAFLKHRLGSFLTNVKPPADAPPVQSGSEKTARPVPLLLTILGLGQLVLVLVSALVLLLFASLFGSDTTHNLVRWALVITWVTGALTIVLSERLVGEYLLYPLAAGAAVFLVYTLLWALGPTYTAVWVSGSGLLFLAAGTLLLRLPASTAAQTAPKSYWTRYGAWLLLGAGLLWAWGSVMENSTSLEQWLAWRLLWVAALTVSAVTLRRRTYAPTLVWSAALLMALLAYFTILELPSLKALHIPVVITLLVATLLALLPDLFLNRIVAIGRGWRWPPIGLGLFLFTATLLTFLSERQELPSILSLLALAAYCLAAGLIYRKPWCGYFVAGITLLVLFSVLGWQNVTARMLPMSGLGLVFYMIGYALSETGVSPSWSRVMRAAGLATGALALVRMAFEPGSPPGLGLQSAALLLAAGLYLTERLSQGALAPRTLAGETEAGPVGAIGQKSWRSADFARNVEDVLVESGLAILLCFALAAGLGTLNWDASKGLNALVGATIIVVALDVFFTRREHSLAARVLFRAAGTLLALLMVLVAVDSISDAALVTRGMALLGLLFIAAGLLYPEPRLAAAATGFLALALAWALRWQAQAAWTFPLIGLAALIYLLSYLLGRFVSRSGETGLMDLFRLQKWSEPQAAGWSGTLRYSALALAALVALSAPYENRLAASIPVATAATLYAIEAFRRRNVWLGFPANGLYLLGYFIVLYQVKVSEPQYYSVGVAVLGLLMHFLLVRAGSRKGAFLTGMVSQLALLGTTYIQMFATQQLNFFFVLFFQGLVVLGYGILIRSRSLVIAPLGFIILGVLTVVLKFLSVLPTAIVIGCTGMLLLTLGILAVVMRERLIQAGQRIGEQMVGWRA